jgi:microsomal dipeptidase-like Zn-dependent dipeptidase
MIRRLGYLVLALLVVAVIGFFTLVAPYVDRRMNQVEPASLPPVADSVTALHATLTIVDLHADPLLWPRDLNARASHGHMDVPRLIEGNVAIQLFGAVTKTPPGQNYQQNRADKDQITLLAIASRWPPRTWHDLLQRALHASAKLHEAASSSAGRLRVVTSSGELQQFLLDRSANREQVAGILAMEGLQALGGNLARLDTLYDAGFRVMGLTHFFDNEVGGSSAGEEKGGLTEFGRAVIRRMEEKHIIVDIAHASPKVISDVLDIATRPVVVSHTGVQGVCPGPRNLSDETVHRVVANGGIIGIGYWDAAVCDPSPAGIARTVKYVVDLAGADHVALGSDFDGATTTQFDTSELAQITAAQLGAGLTPEQVRQVMGGNAVRLLLQGLPPR